VEASDPTSSNRGETTRLIGYSAGVIRVDPC
jgi:hypothetical protein